MLLRKALKHFRNPIKRRTENWLFFICFVKVYVANFRFFFDKSESFTKYKLYVKSRDGHSLAFYNNQLVLFGGLDTITKEKNDLYVYDIP